MLVLCTSEYIILANTNMECVFVIVYYICIVKNQFICKDYFLIDDNLLEIIT